MKFGIHVDFDRQTSNLKVFNDRMIGFQDMGGIFDHYDKKGPQTSNNHIF